MLPLIAAGKRVFAEKPLGVLLAGAEQIASAAAKHEAVRGLGFSYRRIPTLALANEVRSGTIGEHVNFEVVYYSSHAAAPESPYSSRFYVDHSGGGALIDLGPHALDAVGYVIDEVIATRTSVIVGSRRSADSRQEVTNDDVVTGLMRCGRALGTFVTSRVVLGEPNRLSVSVYGTDGLSASAPTSTTSLRSTGAAAKMPHWTVPAASSPGRCTRTSRTSRLSAPAVSEPGTERPSLPRCRTSSPGSSAALV